MPLRARTSFPSLSSSRSSPLVPNDLPSPCTPSCLLPLASVTNKPSFSPFSSHCSFFLSTSSPFSLMSFAFLRLSACFASSLFRYRLTSRHCVMYSESTKDTSFVDSSYEANFEFHVIATALPYSPSFLFSSFFYHSFGKSWFLLNVFRACNVCSLRRSILQPLLTFSNSMLLPKASCCILIFLSQIKVNISVSR